MAESGLSVTYATLLTVVGDYLKLTRNDDNWSTDDLNRVKEIINRGYLMFLYPPKLDKRPAHSWSFLRPTTTVATVADTYVYTLPDDFERIIGSLTFAADVGYPEITMRSEETIRRWRQHDTGTSHPRHYAVVPTALDNTVGQRFALHLWPTPSSAWTLTYRYLSRPAVLSASAQYPAGSTEYSEVIRAAVLAAAELERHEERGVRHAYFLDQINAAISRDIQQAPDSLGWNAESDGFYRHQPVQVTYNGTVIN